MRQRRKPWAVPYLETSKIVKIIDDKKDIEMLKIASKYELEVGLGKGFFINSKAAANTKKTFIGVEAQPSVLATAVMKTEEAKLTNLSYILANAFNIRKFLPPKLASIIYINFPDPWPKARHEKRRLLCKGMLDNFYDILTDSGEIILKTDNQGLYEYSLVSLAQNRYIIISNTEDYKLELGDYPTEYETKFRKLGNSIYRIKARKA
jgi:tRNA (guanine-N7-)-methyltransferase